MTTEFSGHALRVTGIDIDKKALRFAASSKSTSNLDYVEMDALQTGFPDSGFDVVMQSSAVMLPDVTAQVDLGRIEKFQRLDNDTGFNLDRGFDAILPAQPFFLQILVSSRGIDQLRVFDEKLVHLHPQIHLYDQQQQRNER